MANFHTHVTTSSVLGVGYAGMGMVMGLPIETSLVAGGLCGISGMLPDLDSDSGIPLRESMGFAAGIVPMLLIDRFRALQIEHDWIVLITASLYFLIRFAGASLMSRFSVHRGMFHSIPAVLTFAGVAFLICGPANAYEVRYFKAGAVFFGAMSHLVLDELYSIEWKRGAWRFKRSFGTALKFWSKSPWANFSCYAKLLVVGLMVAGEPTVMSQLSERYPQLAGTVQQLSDAQEGILDNVRERVVPGRNTGGPPAVAESIPAGTSPGTSPPMVPWGSPPTASGTQQPSQPLSQPQTLPPSLPQPQPGGGFSPNSGQPTAGSAQPVYSAGGRLAPR